jgi:hypothetical protein
MGTANNFWCVRSSLSFNYYIYIHIFFLHALTERADMDVPPPSRADLHGTSSRNGCTGQKIHRTLTSCL